MISPVSGSMIVAGLKPFELMRKLGMSKTTFYRYVSKVK